MADIDFDDFDQDYPVTRSAAPSRWVNVIGATCSVALVLGLVVWGYKLAVRDVNGVPVVRALEGPLRISPENPGGDFAVHQGLSVNAVAAAGTAAPLPAKRCFGDCAASHWRGFAPRRDCSPGPPKP